MGFCIALHPRHQGRFCPVEEALQHSFLLAHFHGAKANFPAWGVTCLTVNHVGLFSPTHSVRLRKMDGLLCYHRTPGHRSPSHDIVQEQVPRPASEVGTQRDLSPKSAKFTGGSGGIHFILPYSGSLSIDKGHQYRGVASSASLHSKWEGVGVSGMEIFPLPTLRHISPRPPSPL